MGGDGQGEGEGSGGNAFALLMTLLATEKLQTTGELAPADPEQAQAAAAIRASLRDQITRSVPAEQPEPAPGPAAVETPSRPAEKPQAPAPDPAAETKSGPKEADTAADGGGTASG